MHEVAAHLPTQVIGELIGLPREDWPRIQAWAERNTSGQDPEITDAADAEYGDSNVNMAMYAIELAAAPPGRAAARGPDSR